MKPLDAGAEAFPVVPVATASSRYLPGVNFLPPRRPLNRSELAPVGSALENPCGSVLQRLQCFFWALSLLTGAQAPFAFRPGLERWTVKATVAASESETPTFAPPLLTSGPPDDAAWNFRGETDRESFGGWDFGGELTTVKVEDAGETLVTPLGSVAVTTKP